MTKRIEYIDALRGYVMILVVLGHVPMYCYHHLDCISFSTIPTTFHLALFFFISGWFFKNVDGNGNWNSKLSIFIKRKFVQLIVPTVAFYLLYCWIKGIDIIENLLTDKYKAGYWFCLVLFVFHLMIKITKPITEKLEGSLLMFFVALAMIMLSTNLVTDLFAKYNIPNVFCIQQWQYFIFFYMGYWAHRYEERFFACIDNDRIMAVLLIIFICSLLLWYRQPVGLLGIKLEFLIWGGLGAFLSFAFFRRYEQCFVSSKVVGRCMQYIGRRTLEVYLLHFFFLPRNLECHGNYVMGNGNQTVELFVSLTISIMVISLCLLTGNIIRLSPQLAHWLLGVKNE